jgi:hypothetical protein
MLWDGYGDLGPAIDDIPRGMIHAGPAPDDAPPEVAGHTFAFRKYLVFRSPLDGLTDWYRWRDEGPNYWWPDDQTWIVVTEIDGFSTYVGASPGCIDEVLASPLLEALPVAVTDRFDIGSDTINGPPAR